MGYLLGVATFDLPSGAHPRRQQPRARRRKNRVDKRLARPAHLCKKRGHLAGKGALTKWQIRPPLPLFLLRPPPLLLPPLLLAPLLLPRTPHLLLPPTPLPPLLLRRTLLLPPSLLLHLRRQTPALVLKQCAVRRHRLPHRRQLALQLRRVGRQRTLRRRVALRQPRVDASVQLARLQHLVERRTHFRHLSHLG